MSWRHADRRALSVPPANDSEDDAEDKAAASEDDEGATRTRRRRRRRRRRPCGIADEPAVVAAGTPRVLVGALVAFGLGAAGAYAVLTGAYEAAGLAVGRPYDAGAGAPALFRLYKNSGFAACAAAGRAPAPPPLNCSLVLAADLDHPWRLGPAPPPPPDRRDRYYFMSGARYRVPRGGAAAGGTEGYGDAGPSWCDLAGCMADWKVVPSTPRAAALGPTALAAWWSLLITALGSFGALRGLVARKPARAGSSGGGCPGCAPAGVLDRVLLAWEAGQLGFWWWAVPASLGDAAAAAAAGVAPPTTLTGWIVPWVLAVKCGAHPWSCYMAAPTRRRLAAILYALAAVQWAATVYVALLLLRRSRPRHGAAALPSYYDCDAAGIAAAPGESPCSADRLCASPFLFRNPDFAGMDETAALSLYDAVVYFDMAAFPLYLAFRAAASVLGRGFPRLWQRLRKAHWGPFRSEDGRVESRRLLLALFLARGYLHLLYALPFFVSAMDSIADRNAGCATVAYDLGCRAVHVGVSPKHFYLDIHGFDRGLRVVRQWFNA